MRGTRRLLLVSTHRDGRCSRAPSSSSMLTATCTLNQQSPRREKLAAARPALLQRPPRRTPVVAPTVRGSPCARTGCQEPPRQTLLAALRRGTAPRQARRTPIISTATEGARGFVTATIMIHRDVRCSRPRPRRNRIGKVTATDVSRGYMRIVLEVNALSTTTAVAVTAARPPSPPRHPLQPSRRE
jgi:hypothetical protein